MKNKLKVGDTVYLVPEYGYQKFEGEYVVTKVGRKYTYVTRVTKPELQGRAFAPPEYRLFVDDMGKWKIYDQYGSVFESKSSYENKTALHFAWMALYNQMRGKMNVPTGVTIESINEAKKMLNLP